LKDDKYIENKALEFFTKLNVKNLRDSLLQTESAYFPVILIFGRRKPYNNLGITEQNILRLDIF
jgi:hypothetical protein